MRLKRSSPLLNLFLPVSLSIAFAVTAGAGEVLNYGVAKAQLFFQESSDAPEPAPQQGFLFVASFEIDDPSLSASGTITLPDGNTRGLTRVPNSTNVFHAAIFDSEAALNEAYPFGVYTFSLTVDGAEHSGNVNLVETPFPSAPHVVNYDDLQAVDPTESFIIEWAPVPEGTAGDFIFVDELGDFRSPEPWEPGVLTGVDTSIEIDAGVLEANASFEPVVYFAGVVDNETSAIPGAIGTAIVGTWTQFNLLTTGDPNGGPGGFQITTSSLPNAVLGEPYSAFMEASGDVGFWFPDDEDDLPEGLSLNMMSGEISGTPTEVGSFSFEVFAMSQTMLESASRKVTLTVTSDAGEAPPAPVLGNMGFEGGVFSLVIPSTGGAAVEIEVSSDLKNWTSLGVLEPVDGRIELHDADAGEAQGARFYRARWE